MLKCVCLCECCGNVASEPTPTNIPCYLAPQWGAADTEMWGAADAEIKIPSGENTELKRSPFIAWSRSVYTTHATLTARDFFLACFYPSGPFTSPDVFPVLAMVNTGSYVGPQNKICHPAGCRFPC